MFSLQDHECVCPRTVFPALSKPCLSSRALTLATENGERESGFPEVWSAVGGSGRGQIRVSLAVYLIATC